MVGKVKDKTEISHAACKRAAERELKAPPAILGDRTPYPFVKRIIRPELVVVARLDVGGSSPKPPGILRFLADCLGFVLPGRR